jgi:hypothetical protein
MILTPVKKEERHKKKVHASLFHGKKRQKTSQDDDTESEEERKKVAFAMVRKHVRLASIKLQRLREEVEPSGLVTAEILLEAYKSHTIRAEIVSQVLMKNLFWTRLAEKRFPSLARPTKKYGWQISSGHTT